MKSSDSMKEPLKRSPDDIISLHDKYDHLRHEYARLRSTYGNCQLKLDKSKMDCNELFGHQQAIMHERDSLKQQCTEAIQKWNLVAQENTMLRAELERVFKDRDSSSHMSSQWEFERMKILKDLQRAIDEKNAALQEYQTVMQEREAVHSEIDQLQENLSRSEKRSEVVDNENRTLKAQVQALEREVQSVLSERDTAIKDFSELDEKCQNLVAEKEMLMNNKLSICASTSGNSLDNDSLTGSLEFIMPEKLVKENQALKREIEKLKDELTDTLKEAHVAKTRRDWAFQQRDKVMHERDSLRNMCDKLRKERDSGVSKLAETLKDTDEKDKKLSETTKKLKEFELRESAEFAISSGSSQLSRDSAIETDFESHVEFVDMNLHNFDSTNPGFTFVSLVGLSHTSSEHGLLVLSVSGPNIEQGGLRPGDVITRMGNFDLSDVDDKKAQLIVSKMSRSVHLVVRRNRLQNRFESINLSRQTNESFGIALRRTICIKKIAPESPITRSDSQLSTGDTILMVNGLPLERYTLMELENILETAMKIDLVVQKSKIRSSPHSSSGLSQNSSNLSASHPEPAVELTSIPIQVETPRILPPHHEFSTLPVIHERMPSGRSQISQVSSASDSSRATLKGPLIIDSSPTQSVKPSDKGETIFDKAAATAVTSNLKIEYREISKRNH